MDTALARFYILVFGFFILFFTVIEYLAETSEEEEGWVWAHEFREFGKYLLGHLCFNRQTLATGEHDRDFPFVTDKKQT